MIVKTRHTKLGLRIGLIILTKICVYVESEEELFNVSKELEAKGIIFSLIQDNGTTEFHGEKTYTCLATEPRPSEDFEGITSDLPLF